MTKSKISQKSITL